MTEATKPAPISSNPAMVEFPRDEWGMTSDLRKAGLAAASSVRGNAEKQALFVATLRVLAQHASARFKGDAADIVAQGVAITERDASAFRRTASHGVPTPE